MKFQKLKIIDLRRETPDTVSLAFEVPAHLRDDFAFVQGQYLTLRSKIEDEDVRRSYSICSGAQEGELRVAIKKVEGGVFSTFANHHLKTGDEILVMPPQGKFYTPLSLENEKIYVAFAAGSGITPIISIIKTTLATEPKSRFILFFGNRSFDYIIFREELEVLKNQYPNRFSVHHILSRESLGSPLFQGRMDAKKCQKWSKVFFKPSEIDAFFLCGPEEMIFDIKNCLEENGAEPKKIHFELFHSSAGKKAKGASIKNSETQDFLSQITVIQDGTRLEFMLPSAGSTLLDAAMRAGADLPFSCKGGVCSTCKAKVISGEVSMDINYGLEPDEVAAGYVLTCQAHPKSAEVVISFD